MYVDLAGSTEMAERREAEEMRNVITRYQNAVTGVVIRQEGFATKFIGDQVLYYFSWPRANEDDQHRSVRAILMIIDTLQTKK